MIPPPDVGVLEPRIVTDRNAEGVEGWDTLSSENVSLEMPHFAAFLQALNKLLICNSKEKRVLTDTRYYDRPIVLLST